MEAHYTHILVRLSIDIRKVIYSEMITILDAKKTRSLGFHVLITNQCFNTGVNVRSSNPSDTVRLQLVIREGLYASTEKIKMRQWHENEDDTEYEGTDFDEDASRFWGEDATGEDPSSVVLEVDPQLAELLTRM